MGVIFLLLSGVGYAQKCAITIAPIHLGACCYDFELTHSDPALTISVITANLLTGNGIVNTSTGPAGFTASHTPSSASWGITAGWTNGSIDTVGICFDNTGSPLIIEFVYFDRAGTPLCRDTVSIACPLPPTGCTSFSNSTINCVPGPNGTIAYKFKFDLTNERNCALTNATFTVIQPGGITVTTPTTVFGTPLAPNGGMALGITKTFTGAALGQVTTMRLAVSASGPSQGCQCADTVTIILPECSRGCFDLTPKGVTCDSLPTGQRAFAWKFDLKNLLNCSVNNLRIKVLSPINVVATPSSLNFASPLTTGELYPGGKVLLSGAGATEGSIVRMAITISGPDEFCTCSDTVQVVIPFCDGRVQCFDLASSGSILCNGVESHTYGFRLINRMNCGVTGGTLAVLSPAGVSVSPQMLDWKRTVAPGDTTPQSRAILRGTKGGDTVKMLVGLVGAAPGCNCSDTVRVIIPTCPIDNGCAEIISRRVDCQSSPGPRHNYTYIFDIINRSQVRIDTIRFGVDPNAGIFPPPSQIILSPRIEPGGQGAALQVEIGNALPGELPVQIISVDSTGQSCYDTVRLTLPDCTPQGVDPLSDEGADLRLTVLPNPSRDRMAVRFYLPSAGRNVSLVLVDAAGREQLRSVVSEPMSLGDHVIYLEIGDLPSGSYQAILRVDGISNAVGVQIVK